jgi:hypothetical protein
VPSRRMQLPRKQQQLTPLKRLKLKNLNKR